MVGRFLTMVFVVIALAGCVHHDWRTANRDSAKIAPLAANTPEAVVLVYCARAFSWRGYFGVHCWVGTKEELAPSYTTYHVMSWRLRHSNSVIAVQEELPDRRWYGSDPFLIQQLRGAEAKSAIPKIKTAVASYPYSGQYRVYPGPNSNTFVSYIIRKVPELRVELPPQAIGKDFLVESWFFDWSESQTGVQFSLFGVLGMTVGVGDGIEFNFLGASFGLDIWTPAVKLPIIGRWGFPNAPVY